MKTAVLGFGTVGAGIYEMLQEAEGLEAGPVYVRQGKADEAWKTDDFDAVLSDPSLEAVAEAMGGLEPAFSFAMKTLESGRHFVTANKLLVAEYGIKLQAAADKAGAAFLFSAACGGGVPLLHELSLARRGDMITQVYGILNGTTNYILDRMQRFGQSFEEALRCAQEMGYAEADPSADISGLDALRKIRLAAAVAYGILPVGGLHEGIGSFTAKDIRFYQNRGLILRLIARTQPSGCGASALVEPVLFAGSAPEAAVLLNDNLAVYEGVRAGKISLSGQGAGRFPTASAAIRDLLSIRDGARRMLPEGMRCQAADRHAVKEQYFLRLPEAFAARFPCAELLQEDEDGSRRLLTAPLFPDDMHRLAAEIRKEGGCLSFAAKGEIC